MCTPSRPFPHELFLTIYQFLDIELKLRGGSCATLCAVLSRVQLFAIPWTVAHQAVHGIPQARILERIAIPFSKGSSWPRDQAQVSCVSWIAGRFFTAEPLGMPAPHLHEGRSAAMFDWMKSNYFSSHTYFLPMSSTMRNMTLLRVILLFRIISDYSSKPCFHQC